MALPSLLLGRLADELHFDVGHRLTVDVPIHRPVHERVVVLELVDIRGPAGAAVGQDAGGADDPLVAVALPVPFTEAARRVEHPGANTAVHGVPADALGDQLRVRALALVVPPVVVVAAMSGITDQVLRIARFAGTGEYEELERERSGLKKRHLEAAEKAGRDRARLIRPKDLTGGTK